MNEQVQLQVSKEELALILDGLSTLPLARSYNLFNKLVGLMSPPAPPADAEAKKE